jgi:hypothetical protein
MNKKDLIARVAKQNGMHPVAFGLATGDLTEASAISRAITLRRRAGRLSRSVKWAAPVMAIGALAIVYFCGPTQAVTDGTFYTEQVVPAIRGSCAWLILVITFGLMLACAKLTGDEWMANPDERRFLEPVVGTPKELDVASLLENGGPTVAAWRDLAVQEHGQLFGFDFEVMRVLFQIHAAEQREHQKQRAQLEAATKALEAAAPDVPTAAPMQQSLAA